MNKLFINIFSVLFPLFLLTVFMRYFNNASGFDLQSYVEYAKGHFSVSFTDFVSRLKSLNSILKGMKWLNLPPGFNVRDLFDYNIFELVKFYNGIKGFIINSWEFVFNSFKNLILIIYVVFGYLYNIVVYFVRVLLSTLDVLYFSFGFN